MTWSNCSGALATTLEKRGLAQASLCSCSGRFVFYNTRAAHSAKLPPPRVPDKLLCPYIQAPLDLQSITGTKQNWLHTEVRRSIRKAENLLCSNSRHTSVPAWLLSIQQWLWSAIAHTFPGSPWDSEEKLCRNHLSGSTAPV